jgi:hypothetical protein
MNNTINTIIILCFTPVLLLAATSSAQKLSSCQPDVSCDANWIDEASAIIRIEFPSDKGWSTGTGVFVNHPVPDRTPLLLTAMHLEITDASIGNSIFYYFYQFVDCVPDPSGENLDPRYVSYGNVNGTVLATDFLTDLRLIGLYSVHEEASFLDCSSEPWSPDDIGDPAVVIHHPGGGPKRIAYVTYEGSGDCDEEGCYHCYWAECYPDEGYSDNGSSGAPIIDESGLLRGILSCGNKNATCETDNWTLVGRLDMAWEKLRWYLDPAGDIYVDENFDGEEEHGTNELPFNRLIEGIFAVPGGGNIYVKQGTYEDFVDIGKTMTIHAVDGPVVLGQPLTK